MKKPWKKNLNKLPKDIQNKFNEMENFIVSTAKKIKLADIENGVYEHLGIKIENGKVAFPSSIIPSQKIGRYSKYNVYGRTFSRKDLPKIEKEYSNELPIYGDWSKGSNTVSWTRWVWQTERWLPKFLKIEMESLEQDETSITIKFSITNILHSKSTNIDKDVLYYCNVLQENIGVHGVYKVSAPNKDYLEKIAVEWELLPVGEKESLDNNIDYLLKKHRNPSEKIKSVYTDRLNFFYNELGAEKIITGTDGFNRYFGALLKNDIVILENSNYGNAVYIFFKNWEVLSKLSRVELLSTASNDFERVTHSGNWKNKIVTAIRNHF
ncbi:hypothetical protein [Cytobacillus praedii]|uniref:hypothetical protein n=1 Tax=Cytobacillus praedii TaxID=1742358 RepID=UPI00070BCBF0|nr:hypothetical protein [Cytobacillus praedii]